MDFLRLKTSIHEVVRKYKYVGIVLLAGVVLMMIPGKDIKEDHMDVKTDVTELTQSTLQEELEEILCCVKGAGKVKVMLSIAQGELTLYQSDSTSSQSENYSDVRTQTVVITNSNRDETGLIYQRNPPVYQGAIILSQGADNPQVKLAIVDAVMDVTGLGADKISVLKMQ